MTIRLDESPESSASILERLETQLSSLPVLIDGVPREDLDKSVGGKWSVTENVAHLARHTELTIERTMRILAEKEPILPPYRAEEDPDWEDWRSRSLEDVWQRLQGARATLVAMVQRLTPDELARVGRHGRLGPLALRAWLELYLAHEGHHLYVIARRARGLE